MFCARHPRRLTNVKIQACSRPIVVISVFLNHLPICNRS
jgi:hypothetical protein